MSRARLGKGGVDVAGEPVGIGALRQVLPDDGQPLNRPVVERLGESRALALLGVEHLRQQPLAVRREPRHLGGALVGHLAQRDHVVVARQPRSQRAGERDGDEEHDEQPDRRDESGVRPREHRGRGHDAAEQLERDGRRPVSRNTRRRASSVRPGAVAATSTRFAAISTR